MKALANLKVHFIRALAIPMLALSAISCAGLSQAQAEESVNLRFQVAISGIKALELKYSAQIGETAYSAATGVKVKGLASFFTDFDFSANAQGQVINGRMMPSAFTYETSEDDESKVMNVAYAQDGTITTKRNYELKPGKEEEIAASLTPGTPDPLTILLTMGSQPSANLCTGKWRSYNGAEIIDYEFSRLGAGNYSGKADYQGPAVHCRLELKPVAGVSEKRLRKWANKPPVYDLWFAPATASNGKNLHLLIAAEGDAGKTSFTAWASTAELSGRKIAAR